MLKVLRNKTEVFSLIIFIFFILSYQLNTSPIQIDNKYYAYANSLAIEKRGFLPTYPVVSDGCSIIPDFDLKEICIYHDMEYWIGGEKEDRIKADLYLKEEVEKKHNRFLSYVIYLSVRLGGANFNGFTFTPYRFGYGFDIGDERAVSSRLNKF